MANGIISGSGTQGSPYLIEDEQDFLALNTKSSSSSIYVKQTADITMTSTLSQSFIYNGALIYYDGDYHKITNLAFSKTISNASTFIFNNVSLTNLKLYNFSIFNSGTSSPSYGIASTVTFMKNVHVYNARIEARSASSGFGGTIISIEDCSFQGSLSSNAGCAGLDATGSQNGKTIRTSVDVSINANTYGVGFYYDAINHEIKDCHANVRIDCNTYGAGLSYNSGKVSNCYTTGYIRVGSGGSGLVGTFTNTSSYVRNSFCLLDYIQRKNSSGNVYDIAYPLATSPPNALENNYTIDTFRILDSGGVPIP